MTETLDQALEKVQSARNGLRNEIETIAAELARLEEENRTLPSQTASFSEIKQGILDLVEASGARYAKTHIRPTIIDFAKGAYRDLAELDRYGEPLTLGELDAAVNGEIFPMANTRFLSGGTGQADDLILYAVLSGAVRETMSRMLDQLTPADLGLDDSAAVMTRAEMRDRMAANRAEIAHLSARKAQLESELKKLS